MTPYCPKCDLISENKTKWPRIISFGQFYRKSDSKQIQRFRCLNCKKTFSKATFHPCVNQNKRHKNEMVRRSLCSGVSQRRTAKILNLNRKTVVRKFRFLSAQARISLKINNHLHPTCKVMEFDDLETFEHTKYKPLSVTLAVEAKTRRILGFEVSQMAPKGLLAKKAFKKYGFRRDLRSIGRKKLFREIKPLIDEKTLIKSDSNPYYEKDVRSFFPQATYVQVKGKRGAITGQGELKKVYHDPIFSLNHTYAMLRANINRLFRKTWCTTKKIERLSDHVTLYADYHNRFLIKQKVA